MKRVVYIATREASYSRVSIVRDGLAESFSVFEILSEHKSYCVRLLSVAIRLLWARFTGRFSNVDAVFVGFFAQPILPLVRLVWRGPLIADAYFSLFDTLVYDKRKVAPDSMVARLCFWLDQYMLSQADLCFTDTQAHVRYFRQTFDAPHARIARLWISAENSPAPRQPKASDAFEVFFWGGFIPLQGVDVIVCAASLLRDANVEFAIYGTGQTLDECVHLQRELGASNIAFHGWKSPAEIQAFASQAHLALGIFGTTEKAGRVIPNKVFEALAMGIPLITGKSAAVEELLCDGRDVMLVPRGDAQRLADKIVWARDHYEEALAIGRHGQETFYEVASPSRVQEILQTEVSSLLSAVGPQRSSMPANMSRSSQRSRPSTSRLSPVAPMGRSFG